jgi:hypothetical protein
MLELLEERKMFALSDAYISDEPDLQYYENDLVSMKVLFDPSEQNPAWSSSSANKEWNGANCVVDWGDGTETWYWDVPSMGSEFTVSHRYPQDSVNYFGGDPLHNYYDISVGWFQGDTLIMFDKTDSTIVGILEAPPSTDVANVPASLWTGQGFQPSPTGVDVALELLYAKFKVARPTGVSTNSIAGMDLHISGEYWERSILMEPSGIPGEYNYDALFNEIQINEPGLYDWDMEFFIEPYPNGTLEEVPPPAPKSGSIDVDRSLAVVPSTTTSTNGTMTPTFTVQWQGSDIYAQGVEISMSATDFALFNTAYGTDGSNQYYFAYDGTGQTVSITSGYYSDASLYLQRTGYSSPFNVTVKIKLFGETVEQVLSFNQ